jgi:hypothetical protein
MRIINYNEIPDNSLDAYIKGLELGSDHKYTIEKWSYKGKSYLCIADGRENVEKQFFEFIGEG